MGPQKVKRFKKTLERVQRESREVPKSVRRGSSESQERVQRGSVEVPESVRGGSRES